MVFLAFFTRFRDRVLGYKSPRAMRRQEVQKTILGAQRAPCLLWLWDPTPYLNEGPLLSLATRGGRPGVWAEPNVNAKVPLISGGYRSLCSCLRKSSALSDPTSSSKAIFSSWVRQINTQGSKWPLGSSPIRHHSFHKLPSYGMYIYHKAGKLCLLRKDIMSMQSGSNA